MRVLPRTAVFPSMQRGSFRAFAFFGQLPITSMRQIFNALAMLAAAQCLIAVPAQAADLAAGQAKAASCAVCHGPMGLATAPNTPNLAGQPEPYLAEQLKNYRSGKREHAVMAVIAKPLTDPEIENLAAWYASIAIRLE